MKKYTTNEVSKITGLSIANLKCLMRQDRGKPPAFRPTWPANADCKNHYYSESDLQLLKRYAKERGMKVSIRTQLMMKYATA